MVTDNLGDMYNYSTNIALAIDPDPQFSTSSAGMNTWDYTMVLNGLPAGSFITYAWYDAVGNPLGSNSGTDAISTLSGVVGGSTQDYRLEISYYISDPKETCSFIWYFTPLSS